MIKSRHKLMLLLTLTSSIFTFSSATQAGDASAGQAVYNGKGACTGCHGNSGAGDGAAAVAFNPRPANFSTAAFRLDTNGNGKPGEDVDIINIIKYGAQKYGGNVGMAGRADLSEDEVGSLLAFIRSLKK